MASTTRPHGTGNVEEPLDSEPGGPERPAPAERPASTGSGRIGIGEAAARHPVLVVLPVLICLAAVLAAGVSRSPTYTAKTRMRVSSINLGAPGALSGLSTASQSLASTYALSVDADDVLQPVATRLGLTVGDIRRRVSGSPVPASAVFTVTATTKSAVRSRLIANAVSESLVKYAAAQTSRRSPEDLLAEYENLAQALNRVRLRAVAAEDAYADDPAPANARRLARARTALQTAALEAGTAQDAYRNARVNSSPQPRVQVLRRASTAAGDRSEKLQIFGFTGLVAGLLIGLALATFTANRAVRHRSAL